MYKILNWNFLSDLTMEYIELSIGTGICKKGTWNSSCILEGSNMYNKD